MKNFLKNPLINKILSLLAIPVFGFILLNLTFVLNAVYQNGLRLIIGLFRPLGPEVNAPLIPMLLRVSFILVIGLISWFIFQSNLKTIYKAIFTTVPVATVLVFIGMFLYQWPVISYLVGGLFCLSILYYLYHTKKSWLYYYTVILVGLILVIFTLLGGEI